MTWRKWLAPLSRQEIDTTLKPLPKKILDRKDIGQKFASVNKFVKDIFDQGKQPERMTGQYDEGLRLAMDRYAEIYASFRFGRITFNDFQTEKLSLITSLDEQLGEQLPTKPQPVGLDADDMHDEKLKDTANRINTNNEKIFALRLKIQENIDELRLTSQKILESTERFVEIAIAKEFGSRRAIVDFNSR